MQKFLIVPEDVSGWGVSLKKGKYTLEDLEKKGCSRVAISQLVGRTAVHWQLENPEAQAEEKPKAPAKAAK